MNIVATHLPIKPTSRAIQTTVLAGLLTLAFMTPATAADFPGRLKGATISEAQTTNQPPVASFTHAISGDTVTFDASSSSDPDGSITKYKWSFGDGITAESVTTNHTLTDSTEIQVTLTVVDNNNGVSLIQKNVTPTSQRIADDFSTDTSGNYTILSGGLKISNGVASSIGAWTTTFAIHNKELISKDHTVEADVYYDGLNASAGLMFRANKNQKTGYLAYFSAGKLTLKKYSSGVETWLAQYEGGYVAGTYRLRAEATGNIFRIYVNEKLALEKIDTTYSIGNFIGIRLYPNGKGDLVSLDNFNGY